MVSEPSFAIRILAEKKKRLHMNGFHGVACLNPRIAIATYNASFPWGYTVMGLRPSDPYLILVFEVDLQFPSNMFRWKVQRCWINRPRKAKIWSDHFTVPTLPIVEHVWQQGLAAKLQTDFHHSWHRQLQFTAICPWLHAMPSKKFLSEVYSYQFELQQDWC